MSNPSNRLGKGLEALIPKSLFSTGKTIMNIPISEIIPNPFQPRITFDTDALNALCESIKTHGLNQPILIRRIENHYELIDFISSTGLQIKSDPGTIFIYFGFGFLMLSTFLSYLSFSQIWGIFDDLKNKKTLIILAKTSRSKFSFETEIFKITKDLS